MDEKPDYLEGGWKQKYFIEKVDGTPVDPNAVYFVLRLDKDPHARAAARAYARSVSGENPTFALDILARVKQILLGGLAESFAKPGEVVDVDRASWDVVWRSADLPW